MISLDYAAGYFDGEGTILVHLAKTKRKSGVRLYPKYIAALHTGDKQVLQLLYDRFGGYFSPDLHKGTTNVIMSRLAWENKKALEVMNQLTLIGKEPQRLVFLEALEKHLLLPKDAYEERVALAETTKAELQQLKRHNFHSEKYAKVIK
jgi:LAGLIDADG endonuclease